MQFYQSFEIFQGEATPQYIINIVTADIDCTDPDSWEVKTPAQDTYTIEGEDLARFRKATGL